VLERITELALNVKRYRRPGLDPGPRFEPKLCHLDRLATHPVAAQAGIEACIRESCETRVRHGGYAAAMLLLWPDD